MSDNQSMAAGASAAAAAALRRRRVYAQSAYGVIEVTSEDFLKVIALEPEPLVVRSPKTTFWGGEPTGLSRYLTSVKGLAFLVDYTEDFDLPEGCIVIEAKKIKVPKDV